MRNNNKNMKCFKVINTGSLRNTFTKKQNQQQQEDMKKNKSVFITRAITKQS